MYFSTHDTHSELCDAIRIAKGYRKEKWGYFLRAEAFIMLQRRKKNMQILHILPLNIMKNHMERVFSHWHRTICIQMACIFFDEPEAALSPQRQLTLLMQIYSCAKRGSTSFIIVTHSPIFVRNT
mgnify:CR=1 FL=1